MTATYAAYATQVSDALETLLKTTRVKVEPAVEFVSCGATLHEHFVPKTSLEKHLRKCHGERRPRPISNAAFYYGRRNAGIPQETEDSAGQVEAGTEDGENDGLQSLVGTEAEGQDATAEQEGVIAAIQRVATTAGALYEQVQAWQRIPRAFATMKDNERELVTSSSLRRWLKAELGRPGVLPTGDPLDEELVEYVAGLLDHPDFCQPDLLVLELHEFLGDSVSNIVLALWKFMIVEIGLHSLFKMEKSESGNKIQVTAAGTSQQPATINAVPMSSQTQSTDTVGERDYKRRRTSYRGKVGTKTGPAAFREMIQKHMVGLSFETDRELALGGGFCDSEDRGKYPSNPQPARREAVNWRNFTDALEVRNRSRSRRQDQPSSKNCGSVSPSRSRGRSNMSDKNGVVDNAHRRHQNNPSSDWSRRRRSPERRHRRSRSRSRSPRKRDHRGSDRYHSSRTKRSTSVDRGKHRHDRHRGDHRH